MDLTLLFKACVKTIKTKNRAFGQTGENDKTRILHGRHSKHEFTIKSKDVVQQITRLYEFLAEHQQAYLNFSNHLPGHPEMTDSERDKIDAGAQRIINTCSNFIKDLGQEIAADHSKKKQVYDHQSTVVSLMEDYLRRVCKMYSEQRAIRIQCTVELKKLAKIDSGNKKKNSSTPQEANSQPEKGENFSGDSNSSPFLEDKLSAEELQMFELENNDLYNELNSLSEEVREIESKVVKIAELQEIFTEKVLQQDKDMDLVAATIVGTTENVRDANDQIRAAIQRNAGLRVWVLFFLLVMSFSLLFLDWYND